MKKNTEKTKECPFCYKIIHIDSEYCPNCDTSFGKKIKNENKQHKHSCAKGDQARRTDSDYEGGYVD